MSGHFGAYALSAGKHRVMEMRIEQGVLRITRITLKRTDLGFFSSNVVAKLSRSLVLFPAQLFLRVMIVGQVFGGGSLRYGLIGFSRFETQ
jgi:hypothetical protein